MPPFSRGFTWRQSFRRRISSRIAGSKKPSSATLRIPRDPTKKHHPGSGETTRSERTNAFSILERILPKGSKARRYVLRLVILSPILGMGMIHSPFEIMRVNGDSMSPLFNPNYDPDADLPNAHSDSILVRIRSIPNVLPDVNAMRKVRRKAENKESIADDGDRISKFERGQIVTFHTPHTPDRLAVKRIVGLPGDRIQPLPGYPGGDDTVIVPWNHLWVEGDVESRQRSIDSNWYGPISQNLVVGDVKAVLTPWWRPRWIEWKEHMWPALEKGRVEAAAVVEAASDPQVVTILQEWTDGTNQERLQAMRESPEAFKAYFASSEDVRKRVRRFYRNAALVLAKDDPDSERFELAQEIIKEMENIYTVGALRQGMVKRSAKIATSTLTPEDQQAALSAEKSLKTHGWTIERDAQGKVRTRTPTNQ